MYNTDNDDELCGRQAWAVGQVSMELGQAEPSITIYILIFIQKLGYIYKYHGERVPVAIMDLVTGKQS